MQINPLQRAVALVAAAICLGNAAKIGIEDYSDRSPASVFIAGTIFLLIGLSSPAPRQSLLPVLSTRTKVITVIAAVVVAAAAVFGHGLGKMRTAAQNNHTDPALRLAP